MRWVLFTGSRVFFEKSTERKMTRADGVSSELVSRLKNLDCCAVSDALDKLKLAGVVTGLSQLSSTRRIAGRVLTFKLGVGALASGVVRHNGTTAIMSANPGD